MNQTAAGTSCGYPYAARRSLRGLAAMALLCLPLLASAATTDISAPAGTVVMITGRGTIADTSGTVRAIIKGGAVYNGEIISSSAATYVNLRFSDGGMTLLRPNSRFKVEDFRNVQPANAPAAPEPAPSAGTAGTSSLQQIPDVTPGPGSRAFFRLLKGGFRAISGLIGRVNHDDYSVATPVATIGIRGTDYIAVLCDNTCASDPVILKSLPNGVRPEGGLVTAVKHGRIALGTQGLCPSNPAGAAPRSDCVEINGGEYHFTSADGQQVELPAEPQFMKVDPIPDPQSCKS